MIKDKIKNNIILAPYTTFKIGGPAKYFVEVKTKEELQEAIAYSQAENLAWFILGGGSNLLVSDQGFDGLVIKLKNEDLIDKGEQLIAGAGARLSDLVALSEIKGLSGLEWASGIPGSVGGAVRGNAGAYGQATGEALLEVEFFDTSDQQFKTLPASQLNFAYRHSLFKQDPSKIIWQAVFALKPGDQELISQSMAKILAERLAKQPQLPSAGCVFKNLTAADQLVEVLAASEKIKGGKLACALVVDNLGFKGQQNGGAEVSQEHANFIVNRQAATAKEVKALIDKIKQAAEAKYQIKLEEEIQYLGLF